MPTKKLYTFSEQQRHHLAFFDQVLERHPKSSVILMGHSVGAFIAQQILEARSESQYSISKVIHLFPTLEHIQSTPNGSKISVG